MTWYLELLTLIIMFFLHVIEDFHLQGKLANFKQRGWVKHEVDKEGSRVYTERCKYDYLVGLCYHSFEWSFCISLPLLVWTFTLYTELFGCYFVLLGVNSLLHGIVDNMKCNLFGKWQLTLVQDQVIHLVQIIMTWGLFIILM